MEKGCGEQLTKVFGLHDLDEWQLRASNNIDLYLHANVETISLNYDASSIGKVNVQDTLRKFEKI